MPVGSGSRSRPLATVFSRRLRRNVVVMTSFSVVAFAMVLDRVLSENTRRSREQQAHACVAALVPGPNGDLSRSVARLQSRIPALQAVATLDTAGNLQTVFPERPGHRSAVNAALADAGACATIIDPVNGRSIEVGSVTLPLTGDPSGAAQQVLVLLQIESYRAPWASAAALFALLMAGFALLTLHSLRRWFEGSITVPLRRVVSAMRDPERLPAAASRRSGNQGRETTEIASLFGDLMQAMEESEERAQQVERDMLRKIQTHQKGFDRALRRAKDQATTDDLTGLKNRTYLSDMLDPLYAVQRQRNADLTIVMIDMDNFKHYNDAHGHLVGDALLRFVGTLLKSAIRPTDHAIRYGGDEFLLLLPDAGIQEASVVAERIVKLFRQYASRLGSKPPLSLSAGVASIRMDTAQNGEELVSVADAALYEAKRQGKNAVVVSQAA